ncbi:MAG: metallophosphoesterase [Victivallaceae bacterium]|nr:metallophosphoesterase [Victivallaceae bacterium]
MILDSIKARQKQIFRNPMRRGCALSLCAIFLCAVNLVFGGDEVVQRKILATSDMHGMLTSSDGGMTRYATRLQQERRNAASPMLVIDCGDTLCGSYSALKTQGALPRAVFDMLKVDVFVPGNHEFEFTPERFAQLAPPQSVAANLTLQHRKYPGWKLFELDKIRIAVIGLAEFHTAKRFLPRDGFRMRSPEEALAEVMPEIRKAKPDLVVLAVHGGIYYAGGTLFKLLAPYPEIKLILGGHTHEEIPARKVGQALYVQPGNRAQNVSEVVATFRAKDRQLLFLESRLIPLGKTPPSPDVLRKIDKELKKVEQDGLRPLGREISVGPGGLYPSAGALAMEAMLARPETDAACFLEYRPGQKLQKIKNCGELFQILRYYDPIVVLQVPAEVWRELQKIRVKSPSRLILMQKPGTQSKKILNVALSEYLAAGAGNAATKVGEQLAPFYKTCRELGPVRTLVEEHLAR